MGLMGFIKFKLGIIFLILGTFIIFFIFNFSSFKTNTQTENEQTELELTKEAVIKFFNEGSWVDYNKKPSFFKLDSVAKEKIISIHLWASWCAPCLNEIPELIIYAKKNKNLTQFILVSLDESDQDLIKFLKSFPEMEDPLFIQIWDRENKIAKKLNADRLPMTLILPKEGNKIQTIRAVVDWKSL